MNEWIWINRVELSWVELRCYFVLTVTRRTFDAFTVSRSVAILKSSMSSEKKRVCGSLSGGSYCLLCALSERRQGCLLFECIVPKPFCNSAQHVIWVTKIENRTMIWRNLIPFDAKMIISIVVLSIDRSNYSCISFFCMLHYCTLRLGIHDVCPFSAPKALLSPKSQKFSLFFWLKHWWFLQGCVRTIKVPKYCNEQLIQIMFSSYSGLVSLLSLSVRKNLDLIKNYW